MFYKGKWYPISTVSRDVKKIIEKKYPRPDRGNFDNKEEYLEEANNWHHESYELIGDALSRICENAIVLAVLSVGCEEIDVTNEVFEGLNIYGEYGYSSFHVDLFLGTIGSGYLLKKNGEASHEAKLEMYGQFLYCPLLMDRKFIEQELAKRNSEAPLKEASSPEIVSKVVEAYYSGQVLTKADYKQQFCRSMKQIAWNATWREVVRECPKLGKAGRRPSGNQRWELKS